MRIENLISERDELRDRWHNVRTERLEIKNAIIAEDKTVSAVRHNKNYRKLKKEQKHISKMIKHIENKICRERKNEA